MRIASCVVSVTIVFALAGPVLAGDTSRVHPKTPPTAKGSSRPELLTLSGMQQQIRQLPRHVLARFDHAAKQATGTKQAVVRRLITQSLDSERIEHRVSAQLSRDLQKEHSTKVLEWLRSDLGRTIARFEEQAWAPQAARINEPSSSRLKKVNLKLLFFILSSFLFFVGYSYDFTFMDTIYVYRNSPPFGLASAVIIIVVCMICG